MGKTKIEWCTDVWNPVVGCSLVSPGCTNCYAMKMAHRLEAMGPNPYGSGNVGLAHYEGTTKVVKGNPVWTGKLALAPDHILTAPLRWKRPRRIFVNSMGDLFHEDVPDAWIDRVFAVMALCPQHTFQVLTKRSRRMREYMTNLTQDIENWKNIEDIRIATAMGEVVGAATTWKKDDPRIDAALRNIDPTEGMWPLKNVWLGVSCEDQARADERIPELLATPAAIRFVSAEPLLGPIDFGCIEPDRHGYINSLSSLTGPNLDWIIAGGESGPGARPMHPDWARSIRDQCAAAGVAFFFKQWGEWLPWHQFNEAKINDDPEQTRFKTMELEDGRWNDVGYPMWCDSTDGNIDDDNCVAKVGKKRAGRLLDGREHNGYPPAPDGLRGTGPGDPSLDPSAKARSAKAEALN